MLNNAATGSAGAWWWDEDGCCWCYRCASAMRALPLVLLLPKINIKNVNNLALRSDDWRKMRERASVCRERTVKFASGASHDDRWVLVQQGWLALWTEKHPTECDRVGHFPENSSKSPKRPEVDRNELVCAMLLRTFKFFFLNYISWSISDGR